ncbi:UDP-N-acetylmuramoyl-L-alanine--D-glutamate ligase [Sulfurimonas sp.]
MQNKNISIFGYGITTKPLINFIPNAIYYDDNCKKDYIDEDGRTIKPSTAFNPQTSNLEITSPGIPPSHPLIKQANNLISEYDFFKETKPLKIWISGTNGKTTTTQMMQHLLAKNGSIAGGNIGTPLAKLNPDAPIWILETSSFTMHYTKEAKPDIYVLLPLSPDHLSWHGNMKKYIADKLSPLARMQEDDIAIIPKVYKDTPTKAKLFTYEDENDLAKLFNINTDKVNFKGAFLSDALLAMSVKKILFNELDYKKINSFILDPHRQEELYDKQKRLWVNDTKATNLDATIAAVKRYENNFIHLILGGDDKGVDLTELFIFLQDKKVKIYAIGSNKEKLVKLSNSFNIAVEKSKNLQDAIFKIEKNLTQNEVALLSPAAASLDEFTSYAQRGNEFKETIKTNF